MALQIDAGGGVEEHALLRVHLQEEVLQRGQADHLVQGRLLRLAEVVQLAELLAHAARLAHHFVDQVVCVNHGAFAALHLAAGQVHHAVAQVEELIGPGEAELLEDDEQDLEVVVLLVAHGVDELAEAGVFLEALDGRADVLRHVHAGAIAAQQHLLVQTLLGVVHPHGAILLVEHALFQPFEHIGLAQHVGLAFVVIAIEVHPGAGIGGVEAFVHPTVHGLPQRAYVGVVGLPLAEHLLRLQ